MTTEDALLVLVILTIGALWLGDHLDRVGWF